MQISTILEPKDLTVGDESVNELELQFRISGAAGPAYPMLAIPHGPQGLLAVDLRALPKIECRVGGGPSNLKPQATSLVTDDDERRLSSATHHQWWLCDPDQGVPPAGEIVVSVRLAAFRCEGHVGEARIVIVAADNDGTLRHEVVVRKRRPEGGGSRILFFCADRTNIVAGETVHLSWETRTEGEKLRLDAKDAPATKWIDSKPQRTQAYTLETEAGREQRQLTINVLERDRWYPMPPPSGAKEPAVPTTVFPDDRVPAGDLYAIFVEGGPGSATARLYRSRGWPDDFEPVASTPVPSGMASSPGVLVGNRLWLIGGSAVDPQVITNRVCYLDLDGDKIAEGWRDAEVGGFDDGARMGHACVVVDDRTIWMIGGLDRYRRCTGDVWSLQLGPGRRGALEARRVSVGAQGALPPRCQFAALRFGGKVWALGGVTSPIGSPLGDIWTIPLPGGGAAAPGWRRTMDGNAAKGAIGFAAAASGNALHALADQLDQAGALRTSAYQLDAANVNDDGLVWTRPGSVPDLPSQAVGRPHSLSMVAYRGRLFLRVLHRDALHGAPGASSLHMCPIGPADPTTR